MTLDVFPNAMPGSGLVGGLLIGLAGATMLIGVGRIAGVSGMLARASGIAPSGTPRAIALAFIIGLPVGTLGVAFALNETAPRFIGSTAQIVIAGLLVGFGTRLGSGCTSGHGVCGLSRLSRRSAVATLTFMASGVATVGLMRAAGLINA